MKIEKLVPEVYYKESRDFAAVGRLLEIFFNYMKTCSECVGLNASDKNNTSLITELLAYSLGFQLRHNYNLKDLSYVTTCFTYLIKNKGSLNAINTAVQVLLNSQNLGTTGSDTYVKRDSTDTSCLIIKVPATFTDYVLLEDLFDYILPAGVIYKFEVQNASTSIFDRYITSISNENIPHSTSHPLHIENMSGTFKVTNTSESGYADNQEGSLELGALYQISPSTTNSIEEEEQDNE